jgi:hypothetical protein
VFRPKRLDRLKLLCWDGSGLVMAYSNGRIEIDNNAVKQTDQSQLIEKMHSLPAMIPAPMTGVSSRHRLRPANLIRLNAMPI